MPRKKIRAEKKIKKKTPLVVGKTTITITNFRSAERVDNLKKRSGVECQQGLVPITPRLLSATDEIQKGRNHGIIDQFRYKNIQLGSEAWGNKTKYRKWSIA